MSGIFRAGTSGWSYKHWMDIFYPRSIKSAEWLPFYAGYFDTVEINATFYHLPKDTTVKNWHERTPDHFLFAVKLSRFITHRKKLQDVDEALENFIARVGYLKDKTGPVLIQLPPSTTFDPTLADAFFQLARTKWPSARFAVEPRHESWFTESAVKIYQKHQIALCLADSGKRFPESEIVTSNFVYLRFHGRESLYSSDYTPTQLEPYAQKIRNWLENKMDVFAYFNNDIGGYAIQNARLLRKLVQAG